MAAPSSDLQTLGDLTFRVLYRGAFALLEVHLRAGQSSPATAEAEVARLRVLLTDRDAPSGN